MTFDESKIKYFKGKYTICFYDSEDEHLVAFFNNIFDICRYKEQAVTRKNYNLLKVELYRALKRGHKTWMLDGSPMHVYLIDISDDENQEEKQV